MNKLKSVFFIFFMLFITGCDDSNYSENVINYNLNIDTSYHEKIFFVLPKDSYDTVEKDKNSDNSNLTLEYSLLELDNNPLYHNSDIYYKKKVRKKFNQINVLLDYNYIEDEFLYSNYVMSCFENYDVRSADDYFEINLSGEFYCMYDMDKLNITVTTNHEVEDTNGVMNDDNYSWTITKDNYQNVNVYYKINRDYDSMLKSFPKEENIFWKISKFFMTFLLIFVFIFLIVKYYKKKRREQEV